MHLNDDPNTNVLRTWDFKDDVQSASQFRQFMADNIKSKVCCCCGRFTIADNVQWVEFDNLHNKDLLLADGIKTEDMPRHAHTTWECNNKKYCMLGSKAANCMRQIGVSTQVQICLECKTALARHQIPPASYVRVDPGLPPPNLEPLNLVEQQCVAPIRMLRHIIYLKSPQKAHLPNSCFVPCMRGHVVAFANPNESLCNLLPHPIHELPDVVQVVLISPAATREAAAKAASTSTTLTVRFPLIMQYAHRMVAIHQGRFAIAGKAVIAEYEANDAQMPSSLGENMLYTNNDLEAEAFTTAFRGDRQGNSKARHGASEDPATYESDQASHGDHHTTRYVCSLCFKIVIKHC